MKVLNIRELLTTPDFTVQGTDGQSLVDLLNDIETEYEIVAATRLPSGNYRIMLIEFEYEEEPDAIEDF